MMTRCDCDRAETIAGAIALAEADEAQRDTYRAHLAICARCRTLLGGEREIERVIATVAGARDGERWEPDLRTVGARARAAHGAWRWAGALAAAAALIIGLWSLERRPGPTVVAQPAVATEQGAARAVAVLNTQTQRRREHEAESLTFAPATSGSMAFDLRLDGRNVRRCIVTKSSGDRALDDAVCRAAVRAATAKH